MFQKRHHCQYISAGRSRASLSHAFCAARFGGEGGEGSDCSAGEQANADFEDKLSGPELLSALQEGGHVIYFRHAQTEKDDADQADPSMSLDDCETQRKLNEVGNPVKRKRLARPLPKKAIPVGNVIASEYCRAWQTADLAFGTHEKKCPILTSCPSKTTPMSKSKK